MYWVYILRCADGSYYTGLTENLAQRLADHNGGRCGDSHTYTRLPVVVVWSTEFPTHDAAFRCERQIKGWSRAKKEALISGDVEAVHGVVGAEYQRRGKRTREHS